MKLKIQTAGGSFLVDLSDDSNSTIKDLKDEINKITRIDKSKMKLLVGYPKTVLKKNDEDKLKDCNINSGDTVTVEIDRSNEVIPMEIDIEEEICLICEEEEFQMVRIEVPSDNSCLFTCVYFITHLGVLDSNQGNNLRSIIAETIERDEETYNEAFLGRGNADYCNWIRDPNSWGGAIELAIFSDYYKIEITCIDVKSTTVIRFGQDKFKSRGILVYDGIHYDPLIIDCGHCCRTLFPAQDDQFLEMAMAIVREARSKHQFTDVKSFTLKCADCDILLTGEDEAKAHFTDTKHKKFVELI